LTALKGIYMAIRSFLAFELPSDIKQKVALVSDELRRSRLNVKWVKAANIHLTVVFMGNISPDDVPVMAEEIRKGCLEYEPFDISLKGLGVFPGTKRPRVLWLGLETDRERLSSFMKALQERLEPFGIKEEKRGFRPHLTLGRFRRPERQGTLLDDLIPQYKGLEGPSGRLEELVMFESELKPQGAEYTKLQSWPLAISP